MLSLNSVKWRFNTLPLILLILSSQSFGQMESSTQEGPSLSDHQLGSGTLRYNFDFSLVYLDNIGEEPIDSNRAVSLNGADEGVGKDQVTLGLERSRALITWQGLGPTALRLVLRPDALQRKSTAGEAVREVGGQAGSYTSRSPTIKFLDAYQVIYSPGPGFSAAIGVFEELALIGEQYRSTLPFGLHVALPAKFSGIKLAVEQFRSASTVNVTERSWQGAIYGLQGDLDRGERLSSNPSTFGAQVPVAADPYNGLAISGRKDFEAGFDLQILAGHLTSGQQRGKQNDTFLQLIADVDQAWWRDYLKLSLDLRYLRSNWFDTEFPIPNLDQKHIALTSATSIHRNIDLLMGASYGTREVTSQTTIDPSAELIGYQIEGGLLGRISRQLHLQVLFAQEHRSLRNGQGEIEVGQFKDNTTDNIRRVGLQLRYLIDGEY